jgi:hypothetical protein
MHYGTPVYTDLLTEKHFVEEMKPEQVKRYKTNELLIDPKAAPPAEPVVAILHWAGKE